MSVKTILNTESQISGKIKLVQRNSLLELYVNGVKQSIWSEQPKDFIGTYWQAAANLPYTINTKEPKFLFVGLGGGTIPKLVITQFPKSSLLCIEIDPQIINIAKNYFSLKQHQNIKILKANANTWFLKNYRNYQKHFCAIWIDAFFGETFSFETTEQMLKKISSILTDDGILIFNRIYNENEKSVDLFIEKAGLLFKNQISQVIPGYTDNDNIIIFNKSPII